MNRQEILSWLRCTDERELEKLWTMADDLRSKNVGEQVHLRGLIELSNYCRRLCGYCGISAANDLIGRYRMSAQEIVDCALEAVEYEYGTVVLQAGEDSALDAQWVADVVSQIKQRTDLAVTLSLGERTDEELKLWREAGADRYLLRFETSNRELFDRIHPPFGNQPCDRVAQLRKMREFGYEIGSGVMIGIPGQTYDDLASDIELFADLDLDMIGVGPFIAHPQTPLGRGTEKLQAAGDQQPPTGELMTYKVVALARIVCPSANIPSTSALATLNIAQGRELGLSRGANVVMPNLTPVEYREMYEIYPSKACVRETAAQCHGCMKRRIQSLGRTIGTGRGDSPNYLNYSA